MRGLEEGRRASMPSRCIDGYQDFVQLLERAAGIKPIYLNPDTSGTLSPLLSVCQTGARYRGVVVPCLESFFPAIDLPWKFNKQLAIEKR